MLTAYFDDSGSHGDTKALVVCGFVSSAEQWLHFESNWRDVLAMPQFDLEHLHMKELRAGKGRFAKFKNNSGLQRDLFDRLQRVLQVRIKRTFAGAVLLDDYDRLNLEFAVSENLGPPLIMAAQLAITKLMAWREAVYAPSPIQIVVDKGIQHWGLLDDRVYERFGFRLIPAKVSNTPALQGADFAAWECHRALVEADTGKAKYWSDLRGSFRAFVDRFGVGKEMPDWFMFDEEEMRRVFELHGVPKR
jgi:hypothetical protein